MKFSRELIKGSTKNLILAVLSEEELYGYQVVRAIRQQSGEMLEFGEGSIYPALHSLEKAGMLESRWAKQEAGRDRKYYALTKKGRRALVDAQQEWKEFSGAVNKVMNGASKIALG